MPGVNGYRFRRPRFQRGVVTTVDTAKFPQDLRFEHGLLARARVSQDDHPVGDCHRGRGPVAHDQVHGIALLDILE